MTEHRQATTTTAWGTMDLDEDIAPLISAVHAHGVRTDFSCQGNPWTPQLDEGFAHQLAEAWSAAQHSGDATRKLEVMDLVVGATRDQVSRDHAYVSFPTPGDARRFHELVLAATDPARGRGPDELHERAAVRPWGPASPWLCDHTFGDLADLLAYAGAVWEFEASVGYPDPFDVRFVIRFPHRDVAPLAEALGALAAR